MKGKAGMLAAIALAMATLETRQNDRSHYIDIESKESPQEKELRLKLAYEKQMKHKGLKQFDYGNYKIWSINQKSANKKAVKLGYIPF